MPIETTGRPTATNTIAETGAAHPSKHAETLQRAEFEKWIDPEIAAGNWDKSVRDSERANLLRGLSARRERQRRQQMAQKNFEDAVREQIHGLIERSVEAEKESLIKEVVKEFEIRVRETVGQASIKVANYFSIQRMGPDLVIRVQIEGRGGTTEGQRGEK